MKKYSKKDGSINVLIKKIVPIIKPEKIILFGSRAKGNNTSESDYDICILKKDIKRKRTLQKEIYLLLYGTGIPADIIVETPEKFDDLKKNKFLIYHNIEEDGRIIYEQ